MRFQERVLEMLKKIPRGKVTTYKIIGDKLGTKAYRAVGTYVKNNPNAPVIPCHRVIKSNGSLGEYSGKDGIKGKTHLLRKEGIVIINGKVDLKKYLYKFK